MDSITIGKVSFKTSTLKKLSKKEAQEIFKKIDKKIVGRAYDLANPKGKRKKASKK